MFENIMKFFKKFNKKEEKIASNSKEAAKERLHLVLMQDRANVSADFLELMKQEIIEVIKKYIDVDEEAIDVRLTNKENADGTNGAPALYANIPILNIKNEARKVDAKEVEGKNAENKADNGKDVNNNQALKEETKKGEMLKENKPINEGQNEKTENVQEDKKECEIIIENNENDELKEDTEENSNEKLPEKAKETIKSEN